MALSNALPIRLRPLRVSVLWRQNALAIAGGAVLVSFVIFFAARHAHQDYEEERFREVVEYIWPLTVALLVVSGNTAIYNGLSRLLPWTGRAVTNFYIQLTASLAYSLLCINLSYYLFKVYLLEHAAPDVAQYVQANKFGLLFLLPLISINFGVFFLRQWKKTLLETERLKKENIKSELASLREHVDPHFLFNNLNILSTLIDGEKETAKAFLENLADVYRYVLTSKKSELVELCEEMEFIEAYAYLVKKRFGEHLSVCIRVEDALCSRLVPPLAVQMLVENVIKHNVVSAKRPLTLEVFTEGETLTVRNNLQPRRDVKSHGSGLDNIRKRYEYLSDEAPAVEKTETHFAVTLPLLDLQ